MTDDRDLLDEFGLGGDEPVVVSGPSHQPAFPQPEVATEQPPSSSFAAGLRRGRQKEKFRQDISISLLSGDIPPGGTETVVQTCSVGFQPRKLIVTETVPGSTVISNIFVGATNQFPNSAGIASSVFAVASLGMNAAFDKVPASVPISVVIHNKGTQPCKVAISLFGTSI